MRARTYTKQGMSVSHCSVNQWKREKILGPKFLGSIVDIKKIYHVLLCFPSCHKSFYTLGYLNQFYLLFLPLPYVLYTPPLLLVFKPVLFTFLTNPYMCYMPLLCFVTLIIFVEQYKLYIKQYLKVMLSHKYGLAYKNKLAHKLLVVPVGSCYNHLELVIRKFWVIQFIHSSLL
jgi:hypothetical protein